MSKHAGFNCTFSVGGNTIGLARDATLNMTADEIEVTTWDNSGWRDKISGLAEWSIDFEIVTDRPNTEISTIELAFLNKTDLSNVRLLDGDGYGFTGTVRVTTYTKNHPMEDAVTINVTFSGRGAPTRVTDGS